MGGQIDQRLLEHLDRLQDHEIGQAVIAFDVDKGPGVDSEVTARAMLDQACKVIGANPTNVRVMPRLGVMYVAGPSALLKQLLADERVSAASLGGE